MNQDINKIIEYYQDEVTKINKKYNYPSNIAHLLYLIIPSFIMKYGIKKDKMILSVFKNIPIYINSKEDKKVQAYYASIPKRREKELYTKKYIVVNYYKNASLPNLIENLVHEFNHALNSYNNELYRKKNTLYVRCGISYITYRYDTLAVIDKDDRSILEEILNTKQTQDIMNILLRTDENKISKTEVSNIIYSLKREIPYPYSSNSYYVHVTICKYLLENKTFVNTLNVLRMNGDIGNITEWFDDITGNKGSYEKLLQKLNEVVKLTREYDQTIWKKITIRKILSRSDEIKRIIENFNNNCSYK